MSLSTTHQRGVFEEAKPNPQSNDVSGVNGHPVDVVAKPDDTEVVKLVFFQDLPQGTPAKFNSPFTSDIFPIDWNA